MSNDYTYTVWATDATSLSEIAAAGYTVGVDSPGVIIKEKFAIASAMRVRYEEGADEGADRDIPYEIIYSPQN